MSKKSFRLFAICYAISAAVDLLLKEYRLDIADLISSRSTKDFGVYEIQLENFVLLANIAGILALGYSVYFVFFVWNRKVSPAAKGFKVVLGWYLFLFLPSMVLCTLIEPYAFATRAVINSYVVFKAAFLGLWIYLLHVFLAILVAIFSVLGRLEADNVHLRPEDADPSDGPA